MVVVGRVAFVRANCVNMFTGVGVISSGPQAARRARKAIRKMTVLNFETAIRSEKKL